MMRFDDDEIDDEIRTRTLPGRGQSEYYIDCFEADYSAQFAYCAASPNYVSKKTKHTYPACARRLASAG